MSETDLYIIFTFITVLGLTFFILTLLNKVTFFYDTQDFVCSFSQVLIPAFLIGIFSSLSDGYQGIDSFFLNTTLFSQILATLTLMTSIFGLIYCIRYSFGASLKTNGFILGTLIYIYKLFIATMLCFAIIGKFQDLIDSKNSTFGTRTAAFAFLGLFSWLLAKLINGHTVEQINIQRGIS